MISVGAWSLGLALCLTGIGLLVGNLTGSVSVARLADFWGLIPLLLGVEILIAQYRARRTAAAGQAVSVRLHAGSLAGLLVLVVVAGAVNLNGLSGAMPWNWHFGAPWGVDFSREATSSVSQSLGTGLEQGVTTVVLDVPPGRWTIVGADVDDVAVEAEITARAATISRAQAAAAGAKIDLAAEGSALHLQVSAPGYDPDFSVTSVSLSVEATITVPRRLGLEFEASTASVEIRDIGGRVIIDTSTGDVEVSRVAGLLTVRTSTGHIVAQDIGGDADVSSSTGYIELTSVGGSVRAQATTGRIAVSEPGTSVDIDATTGACLLDSSKPVAGDWSVDTSTGSVEVRFPRNSDVSLRVRTGFGAISSNLGFSISSSIGEKKMEGTLGEGTYQVWIAATTGAATINGTE